jgi:hypothetical protein
VTGPRLAAALGGLMLVLVGVNVPLATYGHAASFGNVAGTAVLMLPFAVVGVIVARRQPRNAIGWALIALALGMMLSVVAGNYAVIAFRQGHPGLPLARLASVLTQSWVTLILLLPLPIVLFPDGRLPSRRWRPTLWVYGVLGLIFMAGVVYKASIVFREAHVRVDSSGEPTDLSSGGGPFSAVIALLYALLVLAWVVAKVIDYRRSTGVRRQQLKWLWAGGATSVVALLITLSINGSFVFLGIAALPVSIGVGILRYRLYEIDRLISRTLSYAIVTGMLVALFVGLVSLTTDVLPFSSPVGVAASTLAAATLFNPLRRRVQHAVDRRFNRARYDAETIVESMARRLREAVDLEAVQQGLEEAISGAVEPSHLTVWIRSGS